MLIFQGEGDELILQVELRQLNVDSLTGLFSITGFLRGKGALEISKLPQWFGANGR